MSTYDNISELYEKWSSGDAVYQDTQTFYLNVLSQVNRGHYLEIGIGTGRISLTAIQDNPISVTGIDISEKMLALCRRNYAEMNSCCGSITFCHCDVLNLPFDKYFDGAIMPFRTIGHLLTNEELQIMFEKVYHALKPSGWFLFDHYMFSRQWAEEHNNVPILMYQDDKIVIEDRYHYDFEREFMHCQVIVNHQVYEEFDFRWLSPSIIRHYARKAGFEINSIMGEFDGTPWNENSYEQIWCLKKPGNVDCAIPIYNVRVK
ncbi:MAG: class I SAM-dependent methyltransferase [Oscillospiraceae bacterium]|nr:class I SAM-dependent methyltransferase [Oscillospiraceae bacterium]